MSPRPSAPLTLEYVLLGLLDQRPMHGYDLHRELTSLAGIALIWSVKQSRLYALLDKLEQGGLLASELVPGEAHPMRKQFHLTERGRQSLHAWMLSPVQHGRDMRQDFLARLYFAQRNGVQPALNLIQDQRQICLGWKAHLVDQVSSLAGEDQFERLVYNFRIAQVQAMLDWLDACQQELSG